MTPTRVYNVAIFATIALGLLALYRSAFYVWLTATPRTAEQLAQTQLKACIWFGLFGSCLVVAIVLMVIQARKRRKSDQP